MKGLFVLAAFVALFAVGVSSAPRHAPPLLHVADAGVPPLASFTDGDGFTWSINALNQVVKGPFTLKFQAVALELYNDQVYAAGSPILQPGPPLHVGPTVLSAVRPGIQTPPGPISSGGSPAPLPHWYLHNADDSWTDTGSSLFPF